MPPKRASSKKAQKTSSGKNKIAESSVSDSVSDVEDSKHGESETAVAKSQTASQKRRIAPEEATEVKRRPQNKIKTNDANAANKRNKPVHESKKNLRYLFGSLAYFDARFKKVLSSNGVAGTSSFDQNNAIVVRKGCLCYLNKTSASIMDLRTFRCLLMALSDSYDDFIELSLDLVDRHDTAIFILCIFDLLLAFTTHRGTWPGTEAELCKIITTRRAIVQFENNDKTAVYEILARQNPVHMGGRFQVADADRSVPDPEDMMATKLVYSSSSEDKKMAINAVLYHFKELCQEERAPSYTHLRYIDNSSLIKDNEFARVRAMAIFVLQKRCLAYFAASEDWPYCDFNKYKVFMEHGTMKDIIVREPPTMQMSPTIAEEMRMCKQGLAYAIQFSINK